MAKFRSNFKVQIGRKGEDDVVRETHDFERREDAMNYAKRATKQKTVTKIDVYELIHYENVR